MFVVARRTTEKNLRKPSQREKEDAPQKNSGVNRLKETWGLIDGNWVNRDQWRLGCYTRL